MEEAECVPASQVLTVSEGQKSQPGKACPAEPPAGQRSVCGIGGAKTEQGDKATAGRHSDG